MAQGKAIVASKVGGLPELVEEGVSGLLVPPGDSLALANTICELLANPAQRRLMREASRRRFEAGRYTPTQVGNAVMEVHRQVGQRALQLSAAPIAIEAAGG